VTDHDTIVQAAAAMDSALDRPMIGMHADVAIAETPCGPCDLNAVHKAYALLWQIAQRTSRPGDRRPNRTPFRASFGGRTIGTTSMGAMVQEEDRLKLYGLGLILPEDMISRAEPMTSRMGTHYGVRIHTPDGALDLTTAPGMRRGRSARRATAR
jgi:hypothetical protein